MPVTGLFAPTNTAARGPLRTISAWLAPEKDCAPREITEAGRQIFQAGACRCIAELPLRRFLDHVLAQMSRQGVLVARRQGGSFRRPTRWDIVPASQGG